MDNQNNKRIAKNTFVLYVRMAFVMLITLYTVRVVLKALGESDFGVYNTVAGIVTMLSCVSGVLASATQRFYSYSLGKADEQKLKDIFSSSIKIYIYFSLIVLFVGETVGLWFVNTQLNIPLERVSSANWIYQFSVFSFISTIIVVPYSASVIAHEDMGIYAIISTIECMLKLATALLLFVIPADRLVLYGLFLGLVHLLSLFGYMIVCRKKYPECRYRKPKDNSLYKNLISFSGWSLFGSIARVFNLQGNTILVNIFFGPIVNAARAIALQITAAMDMFVNSFIMAIRPPMVKSYAEEDYKYLFRLFNFGNKFVYYCLLAICVPLMFEMNTILNLWLGAGAASRDMILFSQIILVYSIVYSMHYPVTIIMQATGKVKRYFVPVESFTLLCMPLTYLIFKLGFPASYTFYIMVVVFAIAQLIRLWVLKNNVPYFSICEYITKFILPAVLITILVSFAVYIIRDYFDNAYLRLGVVCGVSAMLIVLLTTTIALSKSEKELLFKLIHRKS